MILETVESCYFIGKYLLVDKITLSFRLVPIYLINNRKEGEFENREKYLMILKNSPPFQKSESFIFQDQEWKVLKFLSCDLWSAASRSGSVALSVRACV